MKHKMILTDFITLFVIFSAKNFKEIYGTYVDEEKILKEISHHPVMDILGEALIFFEEHPKDYSWGWINRIRSNDWVNPTDKESAEKAIQDQAMSFLNELSDRVRRGLS